MRRIPFFLLLMGLSGLQPARAVSEAAALFLLISPGPQARAMGESYAATAASSPMAAIMNPAAAGLFAHKNIFGYEYYPDAQQWLPQLGDDLTYDAKATTFGVSLHRVGGARVSVGIATHKIRLNLGTQNITGEESPEPLGEVNSFEQCEGTTLAMTVEYWLRVSMGYTWKQIESSLGAWYGPARLEAKAEIDAHDIGLMLQLPLVTIVQKSGLWRRSPVAAFDFWLDPGFYYSKTNIGGKISYIEEAQADPLPRNLTMGINLAAGSSYRGLTIAAFSWSREVSDLLVERNPDGSSRYLSSTPDLKFWDNVLLGKGNAGSIRKSGYEVSLADCYMLRSGFYEDQDGRIIGSTSGYGINFTQPLRIAVQLLKLEYTWPGRLLSYITFEKHHASISLNQGHPLAGTETNSYLFRLRDVPIF